MTFSDPGANKKALMCAKQGRLNENEREAMNVKVRKMLRNETV